MFIPTQRVNPVSNFLPNQILETHAITVEVRMVILVLHDVDTLNERFTADLFVESKWPYEEANEKVTDFTKLTEEWKPKWKPNLRFTNLITESKADIWYKIGEVNQKKFIFEMKRVKATFYEKLELQNYPFDVQKLSIDMLSANPTSKCLLYKNFTKPSRVLVEHFHDSQEWNLYNFIGVEENGKLTAKYSLDDSEHSTISFHCVVSRRPMYFFWNAFYLIFIITVISFSVFGVAPSLTSSRLQTTITLILTSVSFKWVINRSLPPIAYLTTLDVYSIFAISFMAALNCIHALIGVYASSLQNSEVWILVSAAVFFVTAHLFFLIWIFVKAYGPRRFYKNQEKAYEKELEQNKAMNMIKPIRYFSQSIS